MPGRQSTGPPSLHKPKPKKQKAKRALNALAIAEKEAPDRKKVRQNRLGEVEARSSEKRRRDPEEEDELSEEEPSKKAKRRANNKDENVEIGSDSSGNEWMTGQVDEEDDSELDSDEAMGESDEERFEGYTFRGSSSHRKSPKRLKLPLEDGESNRASENFDLDEEEQSDGEGNDDFGDEGVDLADVLDEQSEGEDIQRPMSKQKAQPLPQLGDGNDLDHVEHQFDEGSILSASEDEADSADISKLESLQSLVSSMNKQDKDTEAHLPDVHESMPPSEYGITSKQKLTVADLASTVTDPQLKKSLKVLADNEVRSSGKRSKKSQKLDVPLPKRQQDRIDRAAAYEKSKETLSRWIDTVKHNRRAEHLSFPLQDPDSAVLRGQNRLLPSSESKPMTDLESSIQQIMQESGLAPTKGTDEDQLQAFEDSKTKKMPIEEVLARREELRRRRDLLFREEIRAKRIKKIKSKRFRKIHRKERERTAAQINEALAADGEIESEEEKAKNDRRRAEERMGAKHRESRWAKGVKQSGRTKWDEDAREGVVDMARRAEELKRRVDGKEIRNEDDSEQSSEDEESGSEVDQQARLQDKLRDLQDDSQDSKNGVNRGSKLASMDFMKRAEANRKAQNDADAENLRRDLAGEESSSEDEDVEASGRKAYGPQKKLAAERAKHLVNRSEFEEREDSDTEDRSSRRKRDVDIDRVLIDPSQSISMSASRDVRRPPQKPKAASGLLNGDGRKATEQTKIGADTESSSDPAPKVQQQPLRSALKGGRAAEKAHQSIPDSQTSPPQPAATQGYNTPANHEEAENSDANDEPIVFTNAELARRAFAGDDVLDTKFQEEKEELTKEQDDQIITNTMPGWGAWTGLGVSKRQSKPPPRQRQKTKIQGIAPENRKDAKLKDVIISEKRIKKNGKYLASQLPHPFETRAQYERSLRLPVGPEWTTKETFQGMTKPRVLMKQGVIAPMVKPMV